MVVPTKYLLGKWHIILCNMSEKMNSNNVSLNFRKQYFTYCNLYNTHKNSMEHPTNLNDILECRRQADLVLNVLMRL